MDRDQLEQRSLDQLIESRNELVGKIDDYKEKNNVEGVSLEKRKEYRTKVSSIIAELKTYTSVIDEKQILHRAGLQREMEEEFSVMRKPSGGVPRSRFQTMTWGDNIDKDSHDPTTEEMLKRDELVWRRYEDFDGLGNDEKVESYRKFAGERIFYKYLAGGMDQDKVRLSDDEVRLMYAFQERAEATTSKTNVEADGGYLVPVETEAKIIHEMAFMGPFAGPKSGAGDWRGYPNGIKREVNVNTSRKSRMAAYSTEGADIAAVKAAWAQRPLNFLTLTSLMVWTIQLDQDAASNVEQELTMEMAEGFGRRLNRDLTRGAGGVALTGVVDDIAAANTVESTNAFGSVLHTVAGSLITPSEIIDMKYTIDKSYRMTPDFHMQFSDYCMGAIEQIVDADGRFLYHRSQEGLGLILHGVNAFTNNGFADAAASTINGVCGAFKKFRVGYVRGMYMTKYREHFMPALQLGIQCYYRVGSVNTVPEAFSAFEFKA